MSRSEPRRTLIVASVATPAMPSSPWTSSVMTRNDSTVNQSGAQPVARRMSSSRDASATSKWYPSCSSRFRVSTTWLTVGPSRSSPSSWALSATVALPASSDTTKRVALPTASGVTCSYASGRFAIALTCRPALCANAEVPT